MLSDISTVHAAIVEIRGDMREGWQRADVLGVAAIIVSGLALVVSLAAIRYCVVQTGAIRGRERANARRAIVVEPELEQRRQWRLRTRAHTRTPKKTLLLARETEVMSTSIQQIGGRLHQAKLLAASASKEAEAVDSQIGRLTGTTCRIGTIVSMIHSIANQTNLLALNATIEAARAGEALPWGQRK